jgi:hypothetical protein
MCVLWGQRLLVAGGGEGGIDMFGEVRTSTHVDDVVAVEVTIDGMLVIADRLNVMEFPPSLGIRPNIPQLELRNIVWDQVARDLAAQDVLDVFGTPHPEVALMVDTLSRADRTLEGRWWRRDVGGKMVRFVVCRKGDRHVLAGRDGDMIVLQRIAPQVGLAGMVTAVLGPSPAADVEPLTGVASKLGESTTAHQLARFGIDAQSARVYADVISAPSSWVEITATERHPGGTYTHAEVATGVLDSHQGRIVSLPRRVNGDLYGSFLPGTSENLQRALDALMDFLPSKAWFEKASRDADFP